MTQFEKFKNMDINQLAEWIDEYGQFDSSPWMLWFDHKYCKNCPDVMCYYEDGKYEVPCAWCELEGKCKFFQEMSEVPDNKTIIRLYLASQ